MKKVVDKRGTEDGTEGADGDEEEQIINELLLQGNSFES